MNVDLPEPLKATMEKFFIYWGNAFGFVVFMNRFIKSIDDPDKFIFLAFLSQAKKHLTLALFSSVRRHHVQMGMNMRQVLEASSWAAYALAFVEEEKFCEKDDAGNLTVPDKLSDAKNKWLDENFKIKSDEIKKHKKMINESVAHSNIIYTFNNFRMKPETDPGFILPFFDFEDDYWIKSDLWFIANTTMGIIDLFVGVNKQYKVFQLSDDFSDQFKQLIDLNNKLKSEAMSSKRYLDAMERNNTNKPNQ